MNVSASLDVRMGSGRSLKYSFSMSARSYGDIPSKSVRSAKQYNVNSISKGEIHVTSNVIDVDNPLVVKGRLVNISFYWSLSLYSVEEPGPSNRLHKEIH